MFIQYQEREFQIISVINVKEKNEMLEIICIEKQKEKQKEGEETEWIKF